MNLQEAAFVPNYAAAHALLEMRTSTEQILHLTHPRSIRLRTLIVTTAHELDMPLVPYNTWLQALSKSAAAISAGRSRLFSTPTLTHILTLRV